MFEVRRLRLLRELQLRGTLAAVAEALSYSPSTISQQLAQLEKDAGVTLLEPDGRRVRLTPYGEVLAAHAARVLDLEEAVRAELASVQPGLTPVRIAVIQTAAQAILPRALSSNSPSSGGTSATSTRSPGKRSASRSSARGRIACAAVCITAIRTGVRPGCTEASSARTASSRSS